MFNVNAYYICSENNLRNFFSRPDIDLGLLQIPWQNIEGVQEDSGTLDPEYLGSSEHIWVVKFMLRM